MKKIAKNDDIDQKVKLKGKNKDKTRDLKKIKSNLAQRSFTGIFLVLGAVAWMFVGAVYLEPVFGTKPEWSADTFMAINCLLLLVGIYEIINLRKVLNWNIWLKILIFFMAFVLFWMPLGNEMFGFYVYNSEWFSFWITLLTWILFILAFVAIRFSVKDFTNNDLAFILFWTFYLVFVFKGANFLMLQKGANFLMLQKQDNLRQLGWPTFTYIWVIILSNDIFAYFGGSFWGKHFLAPKISPKKTWEGAITGFVFGVVLSMVAVALLIELSHGRINPLPIYEGPHGKILIYIVYFGLSCLLSFLSQVGDLLFSLLKRTHDVKDFFNIFPGHGGLLDRLDSFSLVVLFTFFFTFLLFSNL